MTERQSPRASSGRSAFAAGSILAICGILAPADLAGECRLTGAAPAADVELARAACQRSTERFTLLYGITPPDGEIELSSDVGYFAIASYAPNWKLVWPTTARMRETFAGAPPNGQTVGEAVEEQWLAVLPHELGHLLLTAAAHERRPDSRPARPLPDWIHEGTAVWMEPPTYRSIEYGILRALQPFVPEVRDLASLSISTPAERGEAGSTVSRTFYPCASADVCGGRPHWAETFTVTTRHFPDGRVRTDTTFHSGPPPPPDPTAANFYAYSAVLVRYLYDRGGPRALLSALDRHLRADTAPLHGLPGLPPSADALQRDWTAWVERWVFQNGAADPCT